MKKIQDAWGLLGFARRWTKFDSTFKDQNKKVNVRSSSLKEKYDNFDSL